MSQPHVTGSCHMLMSLTMLTCAACMCSRRKCIPEYMRRRRRLPSREATRCAAVQHIVGRQAHL